MTTVDTPIAEQKIAVLEKIRQDFVANVSHELRTPLTVIRGYLEILTQSKAIDGQQWQPIFAKMFAQSLRMEQLIADLLFLSRLEVDQTNLGQQTHCDIKTLLSSVCEEAQALSGKQQHHIQTELTENVSIKGNYDELRSAFSNIIFNAVKYTPAGGIITVQWQKKEDCAQLMVTDTGIGIEEKCIPRLTERFYRVDKARSRDNGGTGLGLAIVKHVLIRHQATLQIKSQLGKGSCFTCLFPLSQ